MKMAHVITSLETGGAEIMLSKLLAQLRGTRLEPTVLSLTNIGPVGEQIRAQGIPVKSLGMRRGVPDPLVVLRLTHWLRQEQAQIMQTWMYHADLIGGLAAKLAGDIPVAWGVHQSYLQPGLNKRTTLWTARVCAALSRRLPTAIVCCAEATKTVHADFGYAPEKMLVIPNGFDLEQFQPDPTARLIVREQLGIMPDTSLIGLIARFHLQKDHHTFIRAAHCLHRERPDVHYVLCGDDITWENSRLASWIDAAGIRERVHLLGRRRDVATIQASLDIAALSSSRGEAFPLTIGEAMACGVPCVVTDVGDSALLVGETGRVVPPSNPEALAQAWRELIDTGLPGRTRLGQAARQRIADRFSLASVARRYEELYECLGANSCVA